MAFCLAEVQCQGVGEGLGWWAGGLCTSALASHMGGPISQHHTKERGGGEGGERREERKEERKGKERNAIRSLPPYSSLECPHSFLGVDISSTMAPLPAPSALLR